MSLGLVGKIHSSEDAWEPPYSNHVLNINPASHQQWELVNVLVCEVLLFISHGIPKGDFFFFL